MTGRDLITASLRLIGAVAPGESVPAAEVTDGLAAINRMISSWSNERLIIFAISREEFSLTPGTQTYTMGSGAAFNTSRPQRIERASIELQTTSPVSEHLMAILTEDEWAEIVVKGTSSEIPLALYPEGTYPNETLNVYPIPDTAHKIVLYSWKPITAIASLAAEIAYPPGYEEALIYNGSVRLAPEYGKSIPVEVAAIAQESKGATSRELILDPII